MLIEARLGGRPEGAAAAGAAAAGAVVRLGGDGTLDPVRTRVVLDWVQYRHSFRPPVLERPVVDRHAVVEREVAIDLRRLDEAGAASQVRAPSDQLREMTWSAVQPADPRKSAAMATT